MTSMKADEMASNVPEEFSAEIARLVERAEFEGVQLTGEGGLLPDMIKSAVEAALQGELTAHLGYERRAAGPRVREFAERVEPAEDGADRGWSCPD
jgi:hypothetical protein